jgi:hypothetical protein
MPKRIVAGACVLALGVSACGSSSPSTSTTSASARYQARLNLARCLRAHGVNVPDPSPNGGPAEGGGGLFRQTQASPNFQPAMQACAKYRQQAFPFANLSPAQRAQFQRDLVKFAECMRAHNINVPDPTTGPNGGFGLRRAFGSIDRNSPAFQSAQQACQSNLPVRPGAPPGA